MVEDYKSVILHRKELSSNKELSGAVKWMIEKANESTPHEDRSIFKRLPPNDAISPLDKQTYQHWKANYELQKFAHPFRMRRRSILLQPLLYHSSSYHTSCADPTMIQYLSDFCHSFFMGMDVVISPNPLDISHIPTRIHDLTKREQFLTDDLFKYLKSQALHKLFCVIGITTADLYPGKDWNFSLGHASLTDGVAVISFGRYFNDKSSRMDDLSPLQLQVTSLWTLINVLVHELCHVFGITHCYYFSCLMNDSSSIDEALSQPLFLCPLCLRKLHKVLKFDLKDRYISLRTQCTQVEQHYVGHLGNVTAADSANHLSLIRHSIEWVTKCIDTL